MAISSVIMSPRRAGQFGAKGLGTKALGTKVLGTKVLGTKVLGAKMLGNRLMGLVCACMLATAPASLGDESDGEGMTCAQLIGPGPLIWRMDALEAARAAVQRQDPAVMQAYRALIWRADRALDAGPFSVTHKTLVANSGDPHDYTSLSRYWWPNPDTEDGLPYVQRDGESNPDINGEAFDRRRSQNMVNAVSTLALATWFSGDPAYAAHAQTLIDTWFVAPETRMNPSLNYAQSVPGRADGRIYGIIDTRVYLEVVDAARLLSVMGLLDSRVDAGLRQWFAAYATWLATSELGLGARQTHNNHGLFYDLQLAGFALAAGNCEIPQRVFEDTKARIDSHIVKGGRMPAEERRTRSFHYTAFNAQAMMYVARLGEHFGINLYGHAGADGYGLTDTLELVASYAGREEDWPHQMIAGPPDKVVWNLMMDATMVYTSPAIAAAAQNATGYDEKSRTILLNYLPMTE